MQFFPMRKFYFLFLFGLLVSVLRAQLPGRKDVEAGEIKGERATTVATVFFHQVNAYSLPKRGTINEQLNNKPLFAAGVKNGKLHGSWQSWYQNGMPCDSGNLVKGLPGGVWKHWDSNGQLIALRTYSADKYHRISNEMTRYHPKRISFPLATLYQKNKQAAMKYLDVDYSFSNAGRKEKNWSLPRLVAKNVTTRNNYKPVFDHALHHGLFMNFFPDGIVKDSGYYKNGLRQGMWLHRNTGKTILRQGSYVNGMKVKEWKSYNASGKLQELAFYSLKGELKWRKEFQ